MCKIELLELQNGIIEYDKIQKQNFGKSRFIHRVPELRKFIRERNHVSRKTFDELFCKLLTNGESRFNDLMVHGRPCMTKKELKSCVRTGETGNIFRNKSWQLWSLWEQND